MEAFGLRLSVLSVYVMVKSVLICWGTMTTGLTQGSVRVTVTWNCSVSSATPSAVVTLKV